MRTSEVIDDRYELLCLIGEGGTGLVYKARDRQLDKIFALKLLRPELFSNTWVTKRFQHEIDAASALNHPNLVSVYGHGITEAGVPYLVMDYLPGESLADVLQRETFLEQEEALDVFLQICDGLLHAHQKGLVHLDLKPSNVILSRTEAGAIDVRVVDFGIVKIVSDHTDQKSAQADEICGSPQYMSPEQCQGDSVDARSDIYSLGCMMYETITGSAPFVSDSPLKLFVQHLSEKPKPMRDLCQGRKVDSKLAGIIFRCLEKNKNDRYQSTQKLYEDLLLLKNGNEPKKDLTFIGRKLIQGSSLSGLVLICVCIPCIIGIAIVAVYRNDLSWFLKYQGVTNRFAYPGSDSTLEKQQYMELLNESDSETKPNALFKLGQWYSRLADKEEAGAKSYVDANRAYDEAIALLSKSSRNPALVVQCLQARAANELSCGKVDAARKFALQASNVAGELTPGREITDVRFAGNMYWSSDFDPASLANTFLSIAEHYYRDNKLKNADDAYQRAVDMASKWRSLQAFDPLGLKTYKYLDINRVLTEYASFCTETGNKAKARELSKTILSNLRAAPSSFFDDTRVDEFETIGQLCLDRGDLAEAESLFREVLSERVRSNSSSFESEPFKISMSRQLLGNALLAQKKYSEAESEYKKAIALARQGGSMDYIDAETSKQLAKVHWAQNRREEAIRVLRLGLASNKNADNVINRRKIDDSDYFVPDEEAYDQLSKYLLSVGDLNGAVGAADAVWAISEVNGSTYSHQADVLVKYATLVRKAKQPAKADKLLKQAQKLRAKKDRDVERESLIMSSH